MNLVRYTISYIIWCEDLSTLSCALTFGNGEFLVIKICVFFTTTDHVKKPNGNNTWSTKNRNGVIH